MKANELYEQQISETHTFKPSINPYTSYSDDILANNEIYASEKDPVTR